MAAPFLIFTALNVLNVKNFFPARLKSFNIMPQKENAAARIKKYINSVYAYNRIVKTFKEE